MSVNTIHAADATALGNGFVVGGVYEFQPTGTLLSEAAILDVSYTDAETQGIDENSLRLFRWNATNNNWQSVPSTVDPTTNKVTGHVSQLGTFAIGYDLTPPVIAFVAPEKSTTTGSAQPLMMALVTDAGVGVDPASVEMKVDGTPVTAKFIAGTGELSFLPPVPLSPGTHVVTISAKDAVGNTGQVSQFFNVEYASVPNRESLFLPLIQRN